MMVSPSSPYYWEYVTFVDVTNNNLTDSRSYLTCLSGAPGDGIRCALGGSMSTRNSINPLEAYLWKWKSESPLLVHVGEFGEPPVGGMSCVIGGGKAGLA
jgi:hypothetical protein